MDSGKPKATSDAYTVLAVRRDSRGEPYFVGVDDDHYDDWHQSLALSLRGKAP